MKKSIYITKNIRVLWVFRYKGDRMSDFSDRWEWKEKKLGIWWKSYRAVSSKNIKEPKKWCLEMGKTYMFGCHLIWAKTWISISKNVAHIPID